MVMHDFSGNVEGLVQTRTDCLRGPDRPESNAGPGMDLRAVARRLSAAFRHVA